MRQLFSNVSKSLNGFKIHVRYKNPEHHWAVLAQKKYPKARALEHFDDFYKSVYGQYWPNLREALLSHNHKYMAVVNNFSGSDNVGIKLQEIGALDLKAMYELRKQQLKETAPKKKKANKLKEVKIEAKIEEVLDESILEEVRSIYPEGSNTLVTKLDTKVEEPETEIKKPKKVNPEDDEDFGLFDVNEDDKMKPVQLRSIERSNEVAIEHDRIIDAATGLSASSLFEYVPPTKIKGLEDWVLESDHYGYYRKGENFDIKVVKENTLNFPEHLNLYAFEHNSKGTFPNPRRGTTNLSEYFLFDGASVLPVLALNLQYGDSVLDMCAAPGGKSLAILQTMMPKYLVANDVSSRRTRRIKSIFKEYLSDVDGWEKRLFVTQSDARFIEDKDLYNKILVDVPCTTDRHSLHEDEENYFEPERAKERLQLPQLQTDILAKALKIVSVGGVVVYSTCTLSPIQNEGVVKAALKQVWEESDVELVVKDLSEAIEPLGYFFKFRSCSHGHLALPTLKNNWGPMYFCKIQRVR